MLMNFLLRVVLFVVGAVVALSLAALMMVLAMVWMLRAGWARLTGRPVMPWTMQVDPLGGFARYRAAQARAAQPEERRYRPGTEPLHIRGEGGDVTDVKARPVQDGH